jgi:hypothetical protein
MIQRIQSLYLLLATICAVVTLFVSPVSFVLPEETALRTVYQLDMSVWGLTAISIAIAALAVVDIFLFKKRILQARLNIFTAVACVGYYALLAMYVWFAVQRFGAEWYINWSAGMPLVALVLTLMATRAILKDEAAVRAAWSGRLR